MSRTYTDSKGRTIRSLSCAETAKLVRAALKEAFPDTKFSVRSRTYSGGASIDVSYTDGPLSKEVDAVTNKFKGSDFDGMIDLKTYRDAAEIDGEFLSMGADHIFSQREVSDEFQQSLIPEFERIYGSYDPDKVVALRDMGLYSNMEERGERALYYLAMNTAEGDTDWHVFYDAENCYLVSGRTEADAAKVALERHGSGWQYIERAELAAAA